jgi:hypothetical protein
MKGLYYIMQVAEMVQGASSATNSIPYPLLEELVSSPAVIASLRTQISGTDPSAEVSGDESFRIFSST